MIHKEYQGVQWLEFNLFANTPVAHAIFLRHGGYSRQDGLSSLNFGTERGDNPKNVQSHLLLASKILNISAIASARQCHGVHIEDISFENLDSNRICDALTTSCLELGLMIRHADCQVAIIYDPVHRVIANVHCGWRGTVQNIYQKVIAHLQKKYHAQPKDLLIGIGPSLGPYSAEFIHYQTEIPEEYWQYQVKPNYFDFWAISKKQLLDSGVMEHQIEIAEMDTYCSPQDFYSHRYDPHTGRHATIVFLRRNSS